MGELEEKVKEAIEDGSLEGTLETIVEQKVEQKMQEREQQEQENEEPDTRDGEQNGISRRGFLKKAGLGALGLGAASMLPSAAALDIKDTEGLRVYSGGKQYLDVNSAGPVEVLNSDLRLATGQAIEDGSGTNRLEIDSDRTTIRSPDNSYAIDALDSNRVGLHARSGMPVVIRDAGNNNQLLKASTGGPVEVKNADLDVDQNINNSGEQWSLQAEGNTVMDVHHTYPKIHLNAVDANAPNFQVQDSSGTNLFKVDDGGPVEVKNSNLDVNGNAIYLRSGIIRHSGQSYPHINFGGSNGIYMDVGNGSGSAMDILNLKAGGPVEVLNSDLRLATGQAIEDGSGTERYKISSANTQIQNDAGNIAFNADSSSQHRLYSYNGAPWQVWDKEGSFLGFEYLTSSSAPGTLSLSNANLDVGSNKVQTNNFEITENSSTNSLDFNYTG